MLTAWDAIDGKGKDIPGIRWLCLNDRYYLLVKMFGRYDAWHPWIYGRCREVEKDPDGYVDIWGREHYKSTTITYAGGIQEILKDQEITIGIFSHKAPISKKFLAQIKRELEVNRNLIGTFPEILWVDPEKEAPVWSLDSGLVVRRKSNPKEATVEAHGLVEGQPTSAHFKLLIYNDVVTKESVSTPEQIEKTTEAWGLSDNLGVAGGRKWVEGTRYHFADTYSEIIRRGAAKLRLRPATHDGTPDGKPVLLTQKQWEEKKIAQGPAIIAAQMLGDPLSGKQRMFDVLDLRYYEARPRTLMGYLLVDPGRSKKKDSAETAMVVIGVDMAGNKYLLDGVAHKMDLMERWKWLRDLRAKWFRSPGMVGFRVGYETYGAQADSDYFKEQQALDARQDPDAYFEIMELMWPRDGEGAKVDRIQRLGPDVRGHHFFLPYDPDVDPLTDQAREHPGALTKLQLSMIKAGYEYRVAKPIRRKDDEDQIYDLCDKFRGQLKFFPYGGKCDVIDAAARFYDAEPTKPSDQGPASTMEPDYV